MAKYQVLIVDDHPAMRGGIAALLESTPDMEICAEAGNRQELLDVMEGIEPAVAIVDITLNDETATGLELIRVLQARFGDSFPVLVYSMHDEKLYAQRALAAGARGYLMKQAPVRLLLKALRHILEGKIYISANMSQELLQAHVKGFDPVQEAKGVEQLSRREFEVFQLIGKGFPPREIAKTLFISVKTVEAHRAKIREKLGFNTAADLTKYAVDWIHRDITQPRRTMRSQS